MEVAEQPESGDVGARSDTGSERGVGGVAVECRHDVDRGVEYLTGLLVPVVEHPDADRFGQGDR